MKISKNNPVVCGVIGAMLGSGATFGGQALFGSSKGAESHITHHTSVKADNSDKIPYDADGDVFITRRGGKYHRATCGTLSRSKELQRVNSSDAEAEGLSACSKCL